MNFSQKDKIDIFENAISWIVVFGMYIYGGAKLVQFSGAAQIDKTVAELSGMELMWAFYGYSQTYAITLGLLEIIGGTLILISPTRIIGCLFTSTILVNIILQDIFYGVHLGALKAALFYQTMILIVLWLNREKLLASIKNLLLWQKQKQSNKQLFLKLFLSFLLFVIFRIGEYFFTIYW